MGRCDWCLQSNIIYTIEWFCLSNLLVAESPVVRGSFIVYVMRDEASFPHKIYQSFRRALVFMFGHVTLFSHERFILTKRCARSFPSRSSRAIFVIFSEFHSASRVGRNLWISHEAAPPPRMFLPSVHVSWLCSHASRVPCACRPERHCTFLWTVVPRHTRHLRVHRTVRVELLADAGHSGSFLSLVFLYLHADSPTLALTIVFSICFEKTSLYCNTVWGVVTEARAGSKTFVKREL